MKNQENDFDCFELKVQEMSSPETRGWKFSISTLLSYQLVHFFAVGVVDYIRPLEHFIRSELIVL